MKIVTLATAAALALSSTLAFAQSTSAPGASTIGGEPNPTARSSSSTGGSSTQTGSSMSGSTSGGMTTGSSMPSVNDASKSGAPAADNAQKPRGTTTPDNSTTTR